MILKTLKFQSVYIHIINHALCSSTFSALEKINRALWLFLSWVEVIHCLWLLRVKKKQIIINATEICYQLFISNEKLKSEVRLSINNSETSDC